MASKVRDVAPTTGGFLLPGATTHRLFIRFDQAVRFERGDRLSLDTLTGDIYRHRLMRPGRRRR
jgi:hypothetical protein